MEREIKLTGFISRISTNRPLATGPDYVEFATFPDSIPVDDAYILSKMLLDKVHIEITITPKK